jgi:hypothetical protein
VLIAEHVEAAAGDLRARAIDGRRRGHQCPQVIVGADHNDVLGQRRGQSAWRSGDRR